VLSIRASLRDGRPAAGARLWVALGAAPDPLGSGDRYSKYRWLFADADGRARVRLPTDRLAAVRWWEEGVVPLWTPVTVHPNATTEVSLAEPVGGGVALAVTDEQGVPLPCASVSVTQPSQLEWIDVSDDGVQRLDGHTDQLGRRALSHVEPGTVGISGTWALLRGSVSVEVRNGEWTTARLVLR